MSMGQVSQPHAILMVGLPGSGKTFFAEQFSEMFNAPFIDSFFIEQSCVDNEKAEEVCRRFLNEITRTKQTFLYEGDSLSRVRRIEFARWAKSRGYEPMVVWVQTDEATCRRRVRKTKAFTDNEFDSQIHRFTEPHPTEKPVVISGKHTYKTQARTVLSRIGANNRPQSPVVRPRSNSIKIQ